MLPPGQSFCADNSAAGAGKLRLEQNFNFAPIKSPQ
jgi:hypothetical protein